MTKIEWCDITINPIVGCSKCSPGCDNCYAEKMAFRLSKMPATAAKYAGVVDEKGWTGKVNIDFSVFDKLPKKPQRVFVGSMTDLFFRTKEDINTQEIPVGNKRVYWIPDSLHCRLSNIFLKMSKFPQHTFIFLTKRPEEMNLAMELMFKKPLPNLWLGVTACNQQEADEKIPVLMATPAAKRFVSIEPMLGPIDLCRKEFLGPWLDAPFGTKCLDWIICGGETGPGARPMHPDWARRLRDQCREAGVPFFFKKMSGGKATPEDLQVREFPND